MPDGLHIQPFDDTTPDERRISRVDFKDWLQEGKSDCDVAQCLLLAWVRVLSNNDNATVGDLFTHLLSEEHASIASDGDRATRLSAADSNSLSVRFL